jgi:hypothetical protein
MAESREQALDRMTAQAASRGANAVLNVRFSTSHIMSNASEILVYGEAVVVEADSGSKALSRGRRSPESGVRGGAQKRRVAAFFTRRPCGGVTPAFSPLKWFRRR